MIIIEKIKAEIEKRLALQSLIKGEFAEGSRDALNGLLSFLSTLESEKPVPNGLEEAARKYGFEEYRRRCNGGEYGTSEDAFIAGAKWDRNQMLKEAVEGEIQMRYSGCLCAKTIHAINEDKFKFGEKVRLVIIKED